MGNWWDEQQKQTGSLASLQPTVQPPSVPAFDSAANNPYATQLAQGLQAYRNRPSRFSTEPASLPTPAQPPEADKPAFDLGNSLSALYEGATEQFIPGVKSALAQAYTGLERPDRNPEWATRFMEEGRQAQQQADQRTAELQRQGQSDSTSEAIRSAIPSLGFSLGSMAAAIPAGLAGAAATQAAIPIPGSGLVGGALAAGAASGVAGYRMAGSQFLNDTFAQMEQESQKQRGRGLTEQEKATAYQELRPVAENTGLWEAGPEAIGNAALLGLGRVALGLMPKAAMQNLAASALGRAGVRTGAAAGALATEVGTEGVTQFAQGNDQQKGQAAVDALLSGKDMKTAMAAVDPQYQGFQGLVQSTKDVAPATIATVLLMGGLAKPGHMAYSALQERAETNRRGEQTDEILANTQPFRAALDRADAADLSQVLSAFNQIREAGKIPKSAMERLDSAQSAVEAELTRKQAIESQVAADTGQQGAPVPSDFLGPVNADPLADQIAAEDRRAQQSADFNANPRSIGSLLNDWNQRESMRAGAVQGGIAADRARLSEIAQQQLERQRQETLADRTQAIQQQEADRRARLNAEIATRGAPGELARLLGPETQAPTPRQEAPAPQSLSDLLNRPSQSSAVPTSRAGERGSLSDLFPQNRNWWDTELSPSKVTTETPAPPKSGWTRFGNETGTLNIPRAEMPQVKAEHRGALVNFLNARGVAHEADTEVDPATLKPTQAEFSPQKVRKAINYQGGDRSILVSSDGYVLDGHHQWLAALEQGKPIKAIRLDAPIANLLPLTREFPSSTVSTASNVRGGQTGRVETPTTAAPTQPEIPNEARKAEAEAAPLLNQAPDVVAPQPEDSGVAPSPAKTAKGAAPLWNRANEDERIALLRQPSGSAGSSVSDDFARRKAVEWKTWADIPEGPAKNRLREALKNQEIQNAIENPSASTPDGGVGAQPSIRQEGGNPAESSQGIQQGGQENRNPTQETGTTEIAPVSLTSQAPSHIDEQGETTPATEPVVSEALTESVKTTQTAKQKQAEIAGHLADVFKQIDEAITAAPKDKNNANGTVLINVPGDGKFKIANHKQALRDFRGKIEKSAAFKRSGISNKQSSLSKPSSKPTDPGTAIIDMTSSGDIQGTVNALNLADAREYPVIISNNTSINDRGFLNGDWKSDLLKSKPDIYADSEPYQHPVFNGTPIDAVSARVHEGPGKGKRFRIIDRNTGIVIWDSIKSISNRNTLIDAFNERLKSFANVEDARNKFTKNFNSKINDMAKSLGVDPSPSEIKKAMDDRAHEWANAVQGEQDDKAANESEPSKPSYQKNKDEPQQKEVAPSPQSKPDETADQQPTTETNKQTTDAGDELSYNRRNRLSRGLRWSDIEGLNDTLKAKEATKGKVWPRPNYEQLVKDGVSPTIAYFVKHAYDALSPTPKPSSSREILTSQAFEDYINGVVRYMSGVMQWAESTKQLEIDGPYADPVRGLLNDLQNTVYKEMVLHNRELARIGGNQSVGDGLLPRYKVLRKIESVLRDGWPASQEAWQKSYQIRESEQGFYVTKKGYTQRRSDYFKTQDEAIESARQLAKRARGQDQGIDLGTRVDQAERIGIQYRESGKNVSTQDLLDTFGFRGVNFGNWMKGKSNESERQAHINHAYDAFMDLADLLHVPPKAISLNGMLGFAIGAQGHGKGVAAHFVPGVNEINLTRESGAGALAHEWAHALDHYFAVQGGQSTASEPFMTQLVASTKKDMSSVRQEIREAFSRIVKAMRERPKTSEEIEKDNQESIIATRQNVDAWLKSIERKAGISNNSAFNRIADKIRDGKLGDGVMKLGKSRYQVAPTIHELGELVKQVTGRSVDNDQMAGLYGAAKIAKIREERLASGHQSPLDTVTPTTYSKNADALDQGKGGKRYWSTSLEMFARAFDAYVSDRLDAMGGKNSYLSHAGRVGNTVPEGQERKTINSAFDKLISEIKTEKTDSGVRLYSMANKPATPITTAQTRADLSRTLGADVVARLEQSGRLVIHDKPPMGAAAGAQGWVDQKGVIHLVPANLESSALSVVLHESAHLMRDDRFSPENRALGRAAHAVLRMSGLQGLIGNPSYNDLIQNVYRLAAEGNKTAQAALAKATVEPGNTAEEALSYIVEYADEKLPMYRRIMSAIRAALYRLGIKVNLTPADLRALALSALKSRAKEVTARNVQPAFSLPESAEAEAEQDQLWREFQAVRAQFQERQASQSAFERWFGQGVEGVNVHKGKPLTLFHGTNNPEFNRWDESLSGQASRHPTAGLGFFMTADARSAARYGSRLLELNAKINKPYFMTDADLTSIEDTQDATRFRRKLQAQGYDAAVIVAPGAAPYVVAFQSNQVKLTSNTNPTESEDFRYSRPGRPPNLNSPRVAARVMDDIGGVMNDLKPGDKPLAKANPRNFAQMLTDLKANTRPQWLGLLTRNMQLELAREVLPRSMVEQFENAAEAMDAAESKMIQREAFPLADRWQALMRKHREQADRLARSLYMATWTGTDPRQPMPTKKRAEWIRTKAAYDGLTDPESKKLFSEVLGFYQGQTERLFKELQNRIDRHSLPAADKLAAKDMLRQEFERMKDDGPYVPLMRFGDLTVFAEARKEGEKPVFATFETVQDQRAFADWLKNEGYQPQLGVKTEEVSKRALPQGDFVGRLAGIIDKTTQGPEGQVLKDAMYQLFLRSLPEQAIRKHFIHRRFVPGYTADALRTFATFGRRSAKQIARLAHSDRMSDALEAMAKANRDGQTQEPVSAGHLINELEKSFQWAMNPGTNALSSRLTHLGFLWHLGASPAHLFLNLSQQAQVTFPWLAGEMHGKIGSGSVAAALAKANKDFIASNPFTSADKRGAAAKKRRADLEGEFNGDMGRALKALEESGKTDKTQTYSLSGLSEEDSWLWSKPYLRKFTDGAAWFFHVAEVINREASAIAAYRLARRAGMSHEQGYDLARRAINETHFDYSPSNRARFMRGNVAKVLTLFKQYSLNISWQLGRNAYLWARGGSKAEKAQARTKLLGMLGMTMVMAGAVGMPFYGEIMWMLTQLLNATRDDDEPEWDADTEFRSLLDRAFGATGDEAVRHGIINAFMGIDVSSRIKLDDLWWRPIGDDADGKNMAYQMMEQALGPVAGLFVRGVATADGLMESLVAGDNARGASWRAIEGSLPKALKDISRSIRYAEEGATTFQGATLLPADRISALAKLGQAMGFVPAELAERYSENRAMKSLERRILTRRRALLDTVAMGLLNQDDEVVRAASEDIAAFNRRYPTVAITGDTISKSLRGRLRAKIETEAAGGARLDKRLAGMLLEGMR